LGRRIVRMINSSLTHVLKSDSATRASWRQAKRATVKGAQARGRVSGAPTLGIAGLPGVGVASGSVATVPIGGTAVPIGATGAPGSGTGVPVVSGTESGGGSNGVAAVAAENRAA
jgi:hypothetical protein